MLKIFKDFIQQLKMKLKLVKFNSILIVLLGLININAVQALFSPKVNKAELEIVIRQSPKAPLRILKCKFKDQGVNSLKIKEVANTFFYKVKNVSKKNIVSYKIQVKEYFPFQETVSNEYSISSVVKLKPNKKHKNYETRMLNESLDTLCIVSIDEVLFEDGTVWDSSQGIIKP